MKSKFYIASSVLALCYAQGVHAQEDIDLGEIVISGGFTPIDEAAYGRSATVITAEEIETRGIRTVQDALRAVPGVSVSGAGDSFTQVRIRGGEANHTLVLIDGVPAAGGNAQYNFSGLETANIERIEVLRGPQSVFYGSNASSGVINIITNKGGLGRELSGTVEAGDANSASMRYSYRDDRGGAAVSLSYADDKGYDISGDGGEKDGIKRATINLSGDYLVAEGLKLGFTYSHSDEEYEYDATNFAATDAATYIVDDPTLFSDRTERLGQVFAEYEAMGGRMMHRFSLEGSEFSNSNNGGATSSADRKTARYLLSYALDGATTTETNHLLNVIAEYTERRSDTEPGYKPNRASYALEYRGTFDNGLSLQGGLRYDDNSTFADDVTWNISAAYMLASGVRLHASAGEGSVDPSFFELFANSFGYVGNPNLTPEKNQSIDLGVEVPFWQGRGVFDVTLFAENLEDEITDYFDPISGNFTFRNQAGTSKRRGVEVSSNVQATDTLDLRLSYTYLDAENPDGSVEVRRPQHELMLSATQQFMNGRGSVNADLRYVAENYDTQFWGAFQTAKLPDYVTLDLSARYAINDTLTLTGRVTNLFDEDYSDVWGYAKRGRAVYVGLAATF
ncbi:TonB-dependent receptor [Shimia sp. SDUM112013]|uniref:TonB-dependent receptor plug domain-containing protein n=1 Tax=Shimia sp. SDUM112013 TaxID=3136160 RepID=UPI0032ECE188